MMVALCSAGMVLGYAGSAWWWLSGEGARTCALLGLLVLAALGLRLVYPSDYPPGFNPDEANHTQNAIGARADDDPLAPAPSDGVSLLYAAVVAAPLMPYADVIGTRFAVRSYAIVLGAWSVVAAFMFCRALGLEGVASLTAAALLAVLPWSLFYGRLSAGGEITCNQLLLGAALARLIWDPRAGWVEALLGTGALIALLYDYWVGAALLAWPLLALPFARTWRARGWCLAIVLIAALAWIPWWQRSRWQWTLLHIVTGIGVPDPATPPSWQLLPELTTDPLGVLTARVALFARCLAQPVAQLHIWTQPAVAVHPPLVLLAAGAGMLCSGVRRGLFLLASIALGVLPALVPNQGSINGHRALLAFPFVAVAAACAIDRIPRRVRAAVAAAFVCLAATWSVPYFFSPTFWPPLIEATGFPFHY